MAFGGGGGDEGGGSCGGVLAFCKPAQPYKTSELRIATIVHICLRATEPPLSVLGPGLDGRMRWKVGAEALTASESGLWEEAV